MKINKAILLNLVIALAMPSFNSLCVAQSGWRQKISFNFDWSFTRLENDTSGTGSSREYKSLYDKTRNDFASQFLNEYIHSAGSGAADEIRSEVLKAISDFNREYPGIRDKKWNKISLPHSATIEPVVSQDPNWEGVCYYRKSFSVSKFKGKNLVIEFEAAMQQSDVWLNGQLVVQHKGGYTPFSVEVTHLVNYDKPNEIIVRLDNRPGKNFPVGKDQERNGFTYWSGIYRSVFLHVTNPVHITDAVKENITAGGGVFFRTPVVTPQKATALIRTHVVNQGIRPVKIKVKQMLLNASGKIIIEDVSAPYELDKEGDVHVGQELDIVNPLLWHPDHPDLYTLITLVYADSKIVY